MAQIINITSEALQATVRRLLPSQQGFGEDLQASNVVQPIIDLTPTAEGSVLPVSLQQSLNYGGATSVVAANSTVTIANSPGFYRVTGGIVIVGQSAAVSTVKFFMNDGSADKTIYQWAVAASGVSNAQNLSDDFDKIFFLRAGDNLQCTASIVARFDGSVRQVASVNGTLVNPTGFTFE